MNTLGGLLAVVALGPLVGGFVLDLPLGNWARWWYPPLLVAPLPNPEVGARLRSHASRPVTPASVQA